MATDGIKCEFETDKGDGPFEVQTCLTESASGGDRDTHGRSLELCDIHVRDDVRPSYPVFNRRLISLLGSRRPMKLRGDKTLLERFVREADRSGVRAVSGMAFWSRNRTRSA